MNETILNDVMTIEKNISPLSVIGLIAVSLVGAVLLITLCTGGIAATKRLWHRLFNTKD